MNPNKIFGAYEKGFLSIQKLDFALGKNEKKVSGKFSRKDQMTTKRILKTYHTQNHRNQAIDKHHINKSPSN